MQIKKIASDVEGILIIEKNEWMGNTNPTKEQTGMNAD